MGIGHMVVVFSLIIILILPVGIFIVEKVYVYYYLTDLYLECDFALQSVISKLDIEALSQGKVVLDDDVLTDHIREYLQRFGDEVLDDMTLLFYGTEMLPLEIDGSIYGYPLLVFETDVAVRPIVMNKVIALLADKGSFDVKIKIKKEVPLIR